MVLTLSCAAPAALSPDVAGREESPLLDVRLSATPAGAKVVTTGAFAPAFAAAAAAAETASAGTGAPFELPMPWAALPVAGVAEPSVGDEEFSVLAKPVSPEAALVAAAHMAAAVVACEVESMFVDAGVFVAEAWLPSVVLGAEVAALFAALADAAVIGFAAAPAATLAARPAAVPAATPPAVRAAALDTEAPTATAAPCAAPGPGVTTAICAVAVASRLASATGSPSTWANPAPGLAAAGLAAAVPREPGTLPPELGLASLA